jgi:hypothetical protein
MKNQEKLSNKMMIGYLKIKQDKRRKKEGLTKYVIEIQMI